MARTSKTHPLRLDEIDCGGGLLGLTVCPGKQGASLFGDPWMRDLDADLDIIARWGADAVLTLVEAHELMLLDVADLGARVEVKGMDWIHAPIRDVDVPDPVFERRWVVIGHRLRDLLRCGGRVVIHCRGGLGRAGMIAARLLVETGIPADEAISTVRDARPGAIETAAQADHVRRTVAPLRDHGEIDRILGCLLGGAVGDGFGYAVEFSSMRQIRANHGENGLQQPLMKDGRLVVSDDTQMTLFTADAVSGVDLDDAGVIERVRLAYLEWRRTQVEPWTPGGAGLLAYEALWADRAPGVTCLTALAGGGRGTLDRPINNSKGCGGVMRVAPIGCRTDWSIDRVGWIAASAAAHGHPSGFWSAAALAAAVRVLVAGEDTNAALRVIGETLGSDPAAGETLLAVANAVAAPRAPGDWSAVAQGRFGEGWVGEEALAIALFGFLASDDFRTVVRLTANHDGDSDSTASIAGQLFGARHGLAALPWAWVRRLDVFDALCEVAGLLVENREHGRMATI